MSKDIVFSVKLSADSTHAVMRVGDIELHFDRDELFRLAMTMQHMVPLMKSGKEVR